MRVILGAWPGTWRTPIPAIWSCLPFALLAATSLVSYERAKAESLGLEAKGGLMERAERMILLGIGFLSSVLLVPVLWVMLALTGVTAVGRFVKVWRLAEAPVAASERRHRRVRTAGRIGRHRRTAASLAVAGPSAGRVGQSIGTDMAGPPRPPRPARPIARRHPRRATSHLSPIPAARGRGPNERDDSSTKPTWCWAEHSPRCPSRWLWPGPGWWATPSSTVRPEQRAMVANNLRGWSAARRRSRHPRSMGAAFVSRLRSVLGGRGPPRSDTAPAWWCSGRS